MFNRVYSLVKNNFRTLLYISIASSILFIIFTATVSKYGTIRIPLESDKLQEFSTEIVLNGDQDYKNETDKLQEFSTEIVLNGDQDYKNETEKACTIPVLDPWDPVIMDYVEHPQGLKCLAVQPFMTYVDFDGYLRLNEIGVNWIKEKSRIFNCYYQTFDRKDGTDDTAVQYDETIKLENFTKLTKQNVDVKCFYQNNSRKFYWNIHAHPVQNNETNFSKPTEDQLSVIFFHLDSVAASVLKRNLPITYNYTKNIMGIKYFKEFNKVGDNSFPNVMPMFTGKRMYDEQEGMLKEVQIDNQTYFDDFPIIFKSFKDKGYATAFNEDMPYFGLFHYMLKGFKKKPFDFDYHQFWHVLTPASIKGQSHQCFGNTHRAKITLDIAKRHVISMNDKLQIVYNCLAELPHDVENVIEKADKDIADFWRDSYEGGYLNKSAVIFMSDHGIRYGKIRKTTTGALEEQLPFFGLWFPEWFYRKFPHLKENLERNAERLSSSFDVYETLSDILNSNYQGTQRSYQSRGQSQLYLLPKNRTCQSAGIADRYCTCMKPLSVKLDNNQISKAADASVVHLNSLLSNFANICYEIKLSKILYFTELGFNEILDKSNLTSSIGRKLKIGIETQPNNATFEALLKTVGQIWVVEGGISRTSKYSGTSECINDKHLRKFCSCKIIPANNDE